jgi:hypothetical protein
MADGPISIQTTNRVPISYEVFVASKMGIRAESRSEKAYRHLGDYQLLPTS